MADTFQNRLKKALEIRQMKQSELAELTGFSKARISQWVNGKYLPMGDGLYMIADKLHVSESWLMGNDVPMEINKKILEQQVELCELFQKCYGKDAYEAVSMFLKLDDIDRIKVVERIQTLLEDEKYSIKKESSTGRAI